MRAHDGEGKKNSFDDIALYHLLSSVKAVILLATVENIQANRAAQISFYSVKSNQKDTTCRVNMLNDQLDNAPVTVTGNQKSGIE